MHSAQIVQHKVDSQSYGQQLVIEDSDDEQCKRDKETEKTIKII